MPLLSPQQIDSLGKEMARVFVLDDFDIVFGRYPGRLESYTALPADRSTRPMPFLTAICLKAIDNEGTLIAFLSRVVEHKWQQEDFRAAVFGHVRTLARPASDIAPDVAAIIAALRALESIAAADPTGGQCGCMTTCKFMRNHRPSIETIGQSLEQFEALKILHDSLHVLQVKGAEWIDQDDADSAPDLPLPVLQAIVGAVRAAATAVRSRVPAAVDSVCGRCIDTATDAELRLASGDRNQHDFALAQLRGLVVAEPAQLDDCMFSLSRDLPLKQLRGLLESAGGLAAPTGGEVAKAAEALDRLSETMRAHILEHALWQATDRRISAVARLLAQPGPGFLRDLFSEWSAIRQNLRTLVDAPAGGALSIDAALNGAIVLYEKALPTPGVERLGPSPEQRFVEMVAAFNEFRPKAQLYFLAVDHALKSVFSSLLPLRASLAGLLARVPTFCNCPVPP